MRSVLSTVKVLSLLVPWLVCSCHPFESVEEYPEQDIASLDTSNTDLAQGDLAPSDLDPPDVVPDDLVTPVDAEVISLEDSEEIDVADLADAPEDTFEDVANPCGGGFYTAPDGTPLCCQVWVGDVEPGGDGELASPLESLDKAFELLGTEGTVCLIASNGCGQDTQFAPAEAGSLTVPGPINIIGSFDNKGESCRDLSTSIVAQGASGLVYDTQARAVLARTRVVRLGDVATQTALTVKEEATVILDQVHVRDRENPDLSLIEGTVGIDVDSSAEVELYGCLVEGGGARLSTGVRVAGGGAVQLFDMLNGDPPLCAPDQPTPIVGVLAGSPQTHTATAIQVGDRALATAQDATLCALSEGEAFGVAVSGMECDSPPCVHLTDVFVSAESKVSATGVVSTRDLVFTSGMTQIFGSPELAAGIVVTGGTARIEDNSLSSRLGTAGNTREAVGLSCTGESACTVVGNTKIVGVGTGAATTAIGLECGVNACVLVEDNQIRGGTGVINTAIGIDLSGTARIHRNHIVGGCGTSAWGISASSGSGAELVNNFIIGASCPADISLAEVHGVSIVPQEGLLVHSNSILGAPTTGCVLESAFQYLGTGGEVDVGELRNNIFRAQCGGSAFHQSHEARPAILTHNVFTGASPYMDSTGAIQYRVWLNNPAHGEWNDNQLLTCLWGPPRFEDLWPDLHLLEEFQGNACWNPSHTTALNWTPDLDFDGLDRVYLPDIGADEFDN